MIRDVRALIELHEGRRNKMYLDSKGIATIGVGHNLRDVPISDAAIDHIFADDMLQVERNLDARLPWWRGEDAVRKAALLDLCFNMGIDKLCAFNFTLSCWKEHNYSGAASGLLNSLWFKQVGYRGPRIVDMVRTGEWPK